MSRTISNVARLPRVFGYAMGEGGISIAMNGVNNFAMLYFTQVLGLGPGLAAFALSVTTFWDAVTDPVMGFISDRTRTRYGRRHPFLILGGITLAVSFYLLWFAPQQVSGEIVIFTVTLIINLLLRTAVTIFAVPFTALGFEICPQYEARARLQGVRFFVNQVVNFTFGAMAWSWFFEDRAGADGERVDGTLVAANYLEMGLTLSAFILLMSGICIASTWRYAKNVSEDAYIAEGLKGFRDDFLSILKDRLALFVFAFFAVSSFAMVLMGQIQMFTYVFFMEFTSHEKTIVHGAGMLIFACCSLFQSRLVKRYDKRTTGFIGGMSALFGGIALYVVFIGGWLDPQASFALGQREFPLAMAVFAVLQSCWWGGCGMIVPLASSMIADVAAINYVHSGKLKNASYASVFTFCQKTSISVALMLTGSLVGAAGIVSGAEEQTPEATRNIAILTFLSGPVVIAIALLVLRRYPVDREYMEEIGRRTKEMEAREDATE